MIVAWDKGHERFKIPPFSDLCVRVHRGRKKGGTGFVLAHFSNSSVPMMSGLGPVGSRETLNPTALPTPSQPAAPPLHAAATPAPVMDDPPAIRAAQRERMKIFARRKKSVTLMRLDLIAEVIRRAATTSLMGSAGSNQTSIPWDLTPEQSVSLFDHAVRAKMCRVESLPKSKTIVFECLANLIAVFDRDATFFMKFG